MVRKIVRNHREISLQVWIRQQMPPLPGVGTGGVLKQQRHGPDARCLIIDAHLDPCDRNVGITTYRIVRFSKRLRVRNARDNRPAYRFAQ